MSVCHYSAPQFIIETAVKTRTPVLMIQTDDGATSSLRFQDITGVPEEVRTELQENGIAILTYPSQHDALAAFHTLVSQYPKQSALSISVVLGMPDGSRFHFKQAHGADRVFFVED